MSHKDNVRRTTKAEGALKLYDEREGRQDSGRITDLLTDLMHYQGGAGKDGDERLLSCFEMARKHYQEEVTK